MVYISITHFVLRWNHAGALAMDHKFQWSHAEAVVCRCFSNRCF